MRMRVSDPEIGEGGAPMLIRSLARRCAAGLLLIVIVFGTGMGWAAVWDHSCENSIKSLQGTQQRIRHVRGELVAHDMNRVPSSMFVKGEWAASRSSESDYLATEQEMRSLIDLFNTKLQEFAETCLKGPNVQ